MSRCLTARVVRLWASVLAGVLLGSTGIVRAAPTGAPLPLAGIRMMTPTTGWAVGPSGILRTEDGGRTWAPANPPGVHTLEIVDLVSFPSATSAWFAAPPPDRRRAGERTLTLWATADGGRSWQAHVLRLPTRANPGLAATFVAFAGRFGWLEVAPIHAVAHPSAYLFRSRDGGAHWTLASSAPNLPAVGVLTFATDTVGWLEANLGPGRGGGVVFRTADGGLTWRRVFRAPTCSFGDATATFPDPSRAPRPAAADGRAFLMACPTRGRQPSLALVTGSADGRSWRIRRIPGVGAAVASFLSPSAGWLWTLWETCPSCQGLASSTVRVAALLRTDDAGAAWTTVIPAGRAERLLGAGDGILALDFLDPQRGWALVSQPAGSDAIGPRPRHGGRLPPPRDVRRWAHLAGPSMNAG